MVVVVVVVVVVVLVVVCAFGVWAIHVRRSRV
jgi:hypothetical protein